MTTSTMMLDSPVGPLRLTGNGVALTGVAFTVRPADDDVDIGGRGPADDALLARARELLVGYFDGRVKGFDLPLDPAGTPFQLQVWEELRRIPFGTTASYGDIAARLGMSASASRAVGLANGANPIAIIVPCHRVIGSDGSLVGYGGGLNRKRFLLALEAPTVQEALFGD